MMLIPSKLRYALWLAASLIAIPSAAHAQTPTPLPPSTRIPADPSSWLSAALIVAGIAIATTGMAYYLAGVLGDPRAG
jgi:hypothetical protein